jgi:phospholipid/cholesterol/gamma-HCH transport system substrate-binding protein
VKKNKELVVGLFMTVTLVLLYYGFYFLKGNDFFSTKTKYYAVYDNIDQLAAGNPVLVNGYAVGQVSKIKILQKKQNRVLVELNIDSDVMLGDSTKAILDSDFLGGKSILLSIGKVTTPKSPNDTIQAVVAKGMFDVISETATPVADNVQVTLRKFNGIIDNLTKNTQQLDAIFAKLQSTPDLLNQTLSNANGKMDEISGTLKSVAENLNGTLMELDPTLKNFKVLSDSLKQLHLNQTLTRAQQTLASLNQTLAQLKKGDNTASKLLTEDSLYVNLNKLLQSLDSLAVNFNDNPSHFLSPLGKSKKKIDRDRREQEEARNKAAMKK